MNVSKPIASSNGIRLSGKKIVLSDQRLLLLFILLFSALYIIRDLIGIYFPDIIFSGICCVAFFLLSNGAALGMYIFTTNLTVPQNEIMLLYVLVFCAKQFRAGGVRFHKGMFSMVAALLVLQMVDMSLFSRLSAGSLLYDYITKMLYIIIPMLWCMVEITPEQYRNSMLSYMWGALLGALIVVILTANQVGWEALFKGNHFSRLGITVNTHNSGMQSTYNANQLSGMMAITISLALVLMDRKKLNIFIGLLVCGISIMVVALARSRTGLLCTAGAVGLYVLYTIFSSKKVMRGIFFVLSFVLIVALLLYIEPELFDGLMSRFEDQDDITNGRSDLIAIYIQEWLKNPWAFLFGYGIGSFQDVLTGVSVPHNSITDILISWGITGLVIIIATWILLFYKSAKELNPKERVLAAIPAIVAIVISMGGQYLTTGFSHPRLCFLWIAMKALSTTKKPPYLPYRA